jgi:hypothetical protein
MGGGLHEGKSMIETQEKGIDIGKWGGVQINVLITLWVLQYVFTFENPNDDPKPVKCSIYSICINMKLRWNFLDQFW